MLFVLACVAIHCIPGAQPKSAWPTVAALVAELGAVDGLRLVRRKRDLRESRAGCEEGRRHLGAPFTLVLCICETLVRALS